MKPHRVASAAFGMLVLLATGARADVSAEKEADEYMQTWEDRGREACRDNERGCAAAGHALDRAAADYEKAGKLDKAMAIRKMILDPQWHLDYTDYGRLAAFTLAKNLESVGEYGEAAQIVETAVRRFAKSDEAPEALLHATELRLGLGELDRAIDDVRTFSKNYGGKRPDDIPELVVSVATELWNRGRAQELPAFLEQWAKLVDRHGNVRHRALTHALWGRVHAHGGATAKAAAEFDLVRSLWVRPEEGVKQLQALGGNESDQDRRLGQTLAAVGEALFFFGEQKRAEAEALRFPEYTGSGDKESVRRFVQSKASEWMKVKLAAIEVADREYQFILQIQPAPPPRWVIAGAGRVGFLWSNFVADFRRAPTPKEWSSSAPLPGTTITGVELKKLYLEQLASLSEPYRERSKQAFQMCVAQSVRFQWVDEHSRACRDWLEKRYPKTWIRMDELAPQPQHLGQPFRSTLIPESR